MNADYIANDHAIELENLRVERDSYRDMLLWLGNPANDFGYSICADGQVKVKEGAVGLYPDIITAIAFARQHRIDHLGQYRRK